VELKLQNKNELSVRVESESVKYRELFRTSRYKWFRFLNHLLEVTVTLLMTKQKNLEVINLEILCFLDYESHFDFTQ